MILNELAEFFEDVGIGTVGTDLFIGQLPGNVENGIMLVAVPSPEPDKETGIEYQDFEVWTRYKESQTGYDKLDAIFDILSRKNDFTFPNYYIYFSQARGRINDLDRDIEGRKLFNLAFRFTYRNLDLVS